MLTIEVAMLFEYRTTYADRAVDRELLDGTVLRKLVEEDIVKKQKVHHELTVYALSTMVNLTLCEKMSLLGFMRYPCGLVGNEPNQSPSSCRLICIFKEGSCHLMRKIYALNTV